MSSYDCRFLLRSDPFSTSAGAELFQVERLDIGALPDELFATVTAATGNGLRSVPLPHILRTQENGDTLLYSPDDWHNAWGLRFRTTSQTDPVCGTTNELKIYTHAILPDKLLLATNVSYSADGRGAINVFARIGNYWAVWSTAQNRLHCRLNALGFRCIPFCHAIFLFCQKVFITSWR